MSQTPVTVTYSLEEVLGQINQKLNTLNDIRVELAEVKVEIKSLKEDVKELKEDVRGLEGSSKAQIWTLIGILFTAVAGFLVTVGRFVILGNP